MTEHTTHVYPVAPVRGRAAMYEVSCDKCGTVRVVSDRATADAILDKHEADHDDD